MGLLLLIIPFAYVQEEEPFDLGEVVVTATKTGEEVKDLPMSVSVITREEIKASNATTVTDILNNLGGVFVQKTGAFGRTDPLIRGIGQRGRRIMVLIDGRPVKMGLFGCTITHSLPIDNVERIELVRGPASVLYGSDALGGVINIITRKVKEGYETDLTVSGGSYNTQQYLFRHGGKVEKFDYYLTADRKLSDGHREQSEYDSLDYTAKFGYELTDTLYLSFLTKYFHGKKWELGPEDRIEDLPDKPNNYEREAHDLTLSYKTDFSESSFKIYRNYGHHKLNDGWHSKDYTNGAMFKYTSFAFTDNTLTLGVDYRWQGGKNLSSPQPWYKRYSAHKYEYAYYIWNEHRWGDFSLILGGRLNYDEIYGEEFCPQAGFVYRPLEKTRLRLQVSKAFRSPQINELYLFKASNTDLKPERVWNYEFGLTQEITDWLTADITTYTMKGKDLIEKVPNPTPPPPDILDNVGEFEFKGVEAGLEARLGGFRATLYYTYLDTGEHTRGRPEDKIDLIIRYLTDKWTYSITAQHIADYYAEDNRKDRISNYTVVNTKIIYNLNPNWEVFLAVDNLFDEDYQIYVDLPGMAAGKYPMPGQTFTLGMTAKF